MIKLQFKLPQVLISRGFTRRTVFHAPAFQQKEMKVVLYQGKLVYDDFYAYVFTVCYRPAMFENLNMCL